MGVEQRHQRHEAELDLEQRRRRPDAVRVLLLALRSVAGRSDRTGRTRIRELRAQLERRRPRAILQQFKGTLDQKKQLQAAYQLQEIFLNELPYIPLFIGPRWSTYSTKFVKGFVTWNNQYADPIFSTQPQVQIQLLSLYYADAKKAPKVPALSNVLDN